MTTVEKGLDVGELAIEILTGVEEYFAAVGVDLPTRRFVSAGDTGTIAWDCEQLTVCMVGIGYGANEDQNSLSGKVRAQLSTRIRSVIFSVVLVRCITSKPERNERWPSVIALHDDGVRFMKDVGHMSQAILQLATRRNGRINVMADGDGYAQAGAVTPLGPEGGYVGLDAAFQVTVGTLV